MLKKFIDWVKGNVADLIAFLKEHAIEIHIKKKETSETTKSIVVSNLFLIFVIVMIICVIFAIGRLQTILFP